MLEPGPRRRGHHPSAQGSIPDTQSRGRHRLDACPLSLYAQWFCNLYFRNLLFHNKRVGPSP